LFVVARLCGKLAALQSRIDAAEVEQRRIERERAERNRKLCRF
jgi:hypothetical protein